MSELVQIDNNIVDLHLQEGVPWSFSVVITDANGDPVPLTDKIIEMEFRRAPGDATVLLRKDNGTGTQDSGGITDTDALGTIEVSFYEDDLVGATWSQAVYDLKIEDLLRPIQGSVFIDRQVTV